MPQTLHISMPDNLHSELNKLADSDFKKLGEYCKDILIRHVKAEIEKSKPKETKTPGRKPLTFEQKMARNRRERKRHDGLTIEESIEHWTKVLHDPKDKNNDVAAYNLALFEDLKRQRDEETQ